MYVGFWIVVLKNLLIISDYIEDCFGLLPDLCRRHLKHEDPELVPALTKEFRCSIKIRFFHFIFNI